MPEKDDAPNCTVFVRYVPADTPGITRGVLENYLSQVGPIKKCHVIRSAQGEARGMAFCKFTSTQDAQEAIQSLDKTTLELPSVDDNDAKRKKQNPSCQIHVEWATTGKQRRDDAVEQEEEGGRGGGRDGDREEVVSRRKKREDVSGLARDDKTFRENDKESFLKRKARIICRNVAFRATAADVRRVLEESIGSVVDLHLPRVPGRQSQHVGFAFCTFATPALAHNAMTNYRRDKLIIRNRPLVLEWCHSKNFFDAGGGEKEKKEQGEEKDVSMEDEDDNGEEEGGGEDDDDDDEEEEEEEEDANNDDDAINEEEEGEEGKGGEEEGDSDVPTLPSDETRRTGKKQKKNKEEEESSRLLTLFCRNLPFDVTRKAVFEVFRVFGHVQAIFLVRDKVTGIGKGTAFVQLESREACEAALFVAAGGGGGKREFVSTLVEMTAGPNEGLQLQGRRLLVDWAVDRSTAESLRVERTADGQAVVGGDEDKDAKETVGKDRRNLYLKNEGRVVASTESHFLAARHAGNAWEDLPRTDQAKREGSFADKSTKLRSPLFYINPHRLSIKNLAKHVDETRLKQLVVMGIQGGLQAGLVSQQDVVNHWRAEESLSTRQVLQRIAAAEHQRDHQDDHHHKNHNNNNNNNNKCPAVVPSLDIGRWGVKHYIPSLYIERDNSAGTAKTKSQAPSRGFAFCEFRHHAHALACLRELNNNPAYSVDHVAGGAAAAAQGRSGKKKKKLQDDEPKVPRLIVEFTVENKAKAKQQAERRAKQREHVQQQLEKAKKSKTATIPSDSDDKTKTKKKSRGALQREKKRLRRQAQAEAEAAGGEEDDDEDEENGIESTRRKRARTNNGQEEDERVPKATKKKKTTFSNAMKMDKEEAEFERMVQSYKAQLFHAPRDLDDDDDNNKGAKHQRVGILQRRWYEEEEEKEKH